MPLDPGSSPGIDLCNKLPNFICFSITSNILRCQQTRCIIKEKIKVGYMKVECPKCKGEMEEAYVNTPVNILEGKINDHPDEQRSFMPNVAYVCKDCGYIEFYHKK